MKLLPKGLEEICAVYGDPLDFINDVGEWERRYIQSFPLKAPLVYAFATTKKVNVVRAHKDVGALLVETLNACVEEKIAPMRLKFGGSYVWREKRGSAKLSTHTWGISVDLEPTENPLGKAYDGGVEMLDLRVVEIFKLRGWFWGGDFTSRKDCMHFQMCSGY